MKKTILTCMFLTTMAIAWAQEETTGFKKETIEFLKLLGTTSAFDHAIAQLGAGVPELNKVAYTEEANKTLDELFGKMAELYMKEFTHEEIKQLIVFYKSDLGKKMASKQMSLMQQGMMLGQTWGIEVQQIAQKHSK